LPKITIVQEYFTSIYWIEILHILSLFETAAKPKDPYLAKQKRPLNLPVSGRSDHRLVVVWISAVLLPGEKAWAASGRPNRAYGQMEFHRPG
jgi:hypothetical protein